MSLESSLRECSAGLCSDRATERKKCAESLKSFLTGNAAPALLSDNTLKRRGYCWNNLFNDVNEYVLKEIEKYLTSKTFESITKPLATSLLHIVVAGANKGKAYIKSENVTNACLLILKNKQMTKAIGDAYLSLLYKHVVSQDHYVGFISPQTWEDLLDVAITSCGSKHFSLDYLTKLRLVLLVTQNGLNSCQFVSSLRNALPGLQKHLTQNNDKKVQEILVEISIVLLTALSTEYRLAMCEFTETHLSVILSCYDQNADPKKKSQLFRLVSMIVDLHHPRGRLQGESGSLAYNWTGWNRQLNNILELIFFEGNFLQKSSDSKFRQKNDPFKDCSYFFDLAAAAYYQIFNAIKTEVIEGEGSSKRQKVTANKIKCFDDFIEEFRQNPMPWLGIITSFTGHYSHMIKSSSCLALLEALGGHLAAGSRARLCWRLAGRLAGRLLAQLLPSPEAATEYATVLVALWNCCVRFSTQTDASHPALHSILQQLIQLDGIDTQTMEPLMKLYLEGAMPVTCHSIQTLSCILSHFFSKHNNKNDKILCLKWFAEKEIKCDDQKMAQDLVLRLITNENFDIPKKKETTEDLFEILFNSAEKCTLFSDFELMLGKPCPPVDGMVKKLEVNIDLENQASAALNTKLSSHIEKLKKKEVTILEYAKYIRIVLTYIDVLLSRTSLSPATVKEDDLYRSLKIALDLLFTKLTELINNENDNTEFLKCVQVILSSDFNDVLSKEIRSHIDTDFFHSIHKVVTNDTASDCDGDVSMENDDSYEDFMDVRHCCIQLLAAYCRVEAPYRKELLDLILDPKLFRFSNPDDIECAFQCMKLLTDAAVENAPIESVFSLMQSMCKALFRNPKATGGLLKILLSMIDKIWALPSATARDNCCIMIHGYLQRSEKLFYPLRVAALIYKCAASIEKLNRSFGYVSKSDHAETLTSGTKGTTHALRLFCCYLLQDVYKKFTADDVTSLVSQSMELFMINAAFMNEQMIKDESANRTLTFLHIFYALAQTRPTLVKTIVFNIVKVQKDKSLNKDTFQKVLEKITGFITTKSFTEFWNQDILCFLYYWFESNTIDDLPLYLFGCESLDVFLDRNLKWVVPAEILWRESGVIADSGALRKLKIRTGGSDDNFIETCFSNLIVLCLPYIVTETYGLEPPRSGKHSTQSLSNAKQLFHKTREVLGSERFDKCFLECMGLLMLLSASHLADYEDAKSMFGVDVLRPVENYLYSREVFAAILKYYGAMVDVDILHYLSEHQPLAVSKIVVKLWESVLQKKLLEFKCLSLHTYVVFILSLPLGFPTDSFVCNYACSSILHAVEKTRDRDELKMYVTALSALFKQFLPTKADILSETLPRAVSQLMIKKQQGFPAECQRLLDYLVSRSDQTDGVNVLSQDVAVRSPRGCYAEFLETLESFLSSLSCPSFEILCNLREFLRTNKQFLPPLWAARGLRGFSEDCAASALHRAVNALNRILAANGDHKTVIEACNCLATLGTYDMKTLVMSAPPELETGLQPPQQLAGVVAAELAGLLLDEEPRVVGQVMATLARLLKYRDGKTAMELGNIDERILRPFLTSSSNYVQAKFQLNEAKFDAYRAVGFWIPNDGESHSVWVTRVTTALLDVVASPANYVSTLSTVCKSKPNLCRSILPSLIGLVIFIAKENQVKDIAAQINQYLEHIWNMSFCDSSTDSQTVRLKRESVTHDHKMIIQDVLGVINFVRLQRHHYSKRQEEIESFNYLKLDYSAAAWAAAAAGHSLAALYYGELWALAANQGAPPAAPGDTLRLPGGEHMLAIFRKCFISIGELSAIDGCGSGHLTSEDEKRKHLINTGQYSDALLVHDIALSYDAGTGSNYELQYGVIRSLYESGMHHLALQYMKSLPENEKLDDIKYECLSFLGDWSVFVDTQELEVKSRSPDTNKESVLKSLRYACLKDCLNVQRTTHNFELKLQTPIDAAKLAVAQLSQKLNMDNSQSVYKVVSHLQLFNDIEEYYSVRCDKLPMKDLIQKWRVEQIAPFHDFKHVEPLISQRSLILEHAAQAHRSLQTEIMDLQLRYAELGLSNQRVQLSQRLLAIAKKCHSSPEIALVEGQISWAKGHKDISLSLLRDIIYNKTPDVKLKAAALRQYGTWMAESRCESTRDIIDKYLKKSIEVLGRNDQDNAKSKVYCDIAKYADAEYKQVVTYMKSSVFENKVKCMEKMKGDAKSLRSTSTQQALSKDERKALMTNEKLSILDEADINSTIEEKKRFLELAMRYYLLSLREGDASDLSVFRVISLWLDNPQFEFELHGDKFMSLLRDVPSRKYLPVLPQLAPRLVFTEDSFAGNLNEIMKRCAKDHPHHTLPILFSIKNSDKDKVIMNASASAASRQTSSKVEEPRVTAARALLAELSSAGGGLARLVANMERMCDAIISFANYETKSKELRQSVPRSEPLCRLGALGGVPVPTAPPPVRADCDYTQVPGIISFADTFELVGGINCPKKMTCKSSDGRQRTILIKGEDDLRQDAVMQQVFSIVNTLLELNPVTSRNKLSIRTYKVVPLSQRSGVLEWCEGTMPIGTYLVGTHAAAGAHRRYRPKDISPNAARSVLIKCHEKGKSSIDKLAAFLKILREFKPVFHYFFTEHYLDPVTWYERRLAYTKSVATSSMVGYIMGLGDRHLQNILIDKKSAEVIHIDFGIAFDQAKALPTPETIPFRLTQDIVAGFGPSGVEGVFRRCCEETMQLLRDNHEALLTLLEVLLCDPLYSWSISPAEAKRKQNLHATPRDSAALTTAGNGGGGSGGGLAERALLAVSSKLSGCEGGAGAVAAAGQVARLLHAAADPAALSRLYPGWQPYL